MVAVISLFLATSGLALALVAAQIVGFALWAFPVRLLKQAMLLAVASRARSIDACCASMGIYAALGRAATVAGFNAAVALALIPVFDSTVLDARTAAVAAFFALVYGFGLRLCIGVPLERHAYALLEAR